MDVDRRKAAILFWSVTAVALQSVLNVVKQVSAWEAHIAATVELKQVQGIKIQLPKASSRCYFNMFAHLPLK